jgi:signal peptidase I
MSRDEERERPKSKSKSKKTIIITTAAVKNKTIGSACKKKDGFVKEYVQRPIMDCINQIKHMNVHQLLLQVLSLLLIITSALIIWKSLCLYTNSESPVVVVLSGSMEPAFKRGDILFLSLKNNDDDYDDYNDGYRTRIGDIVVFSIDGREIPIVHRVIKSHYDSLAKKNDILTKGDNNHLDDIGLYAVGQRWLNETHIMGKCVGYLPHVGRATILMNDYPLVKYFLISILGLLVISGKE